MSNDSPSDAAQSTPTDPASATDQSVQRLDPETRTKIAAGEVITRPADAVVELVENSLDAGAARIDVRVTGDGTERIEVRDDGCGMTAADAELAVERHATSKVSTAEEVDRVETLGFRGEALPSIAAAAGKLTVTTNDGGPEGTRVVVRDGETETSAAGRAKGTTVVVEDLFDAWPARRKSLGTAATEFRCISDVVSRYALVRPEVRFSLEHDGSEVFSTHGTDDPTDALLGVYDRAIASESTAFTHETTVEFGGDTRPLRVEGVLGYPSVTRATREHLYVAVNGRALRDDVVRRAVIEGYGTLLPDGRYPIAAVNVTVPPGFVDANVHPAKEEVAFRNEGAVATAVETAVSDALTTADLRRTGEVAMDLDSSLQPVESDSLFADLRVIGQFRDLYLLCEADDDLLVVDQHAAHERINFERLRASLQEGVDSTALDPPETVSLTPAEAAAVEEHREELARLGYDIAPFGGNTYRLAGVPAPLGRVADPSSLRDVLDTLRAGERPDDVREELLKDLACHPSLKAGDALDDEDAAALVERLGSCEHPFACPHGRPTVLSIDEETLVQGFERGNTRLK